MRVSVLLVGFEGEEAAAIIRRLLAEGDQVRLVEPDRSAAQTWRDQGAFVAAGDPSDDDLIERAAYEARTCVLFDRARPGVTDAVIAGARMAGVGRIVLVTGDSGGEGAAALIASGFSHVIVLLPKKSLFGRERMTAERLAEAIDAADDLAGEPRLTVDLGTDEGWTELDL
ncbi:MAG: hypothetical protein GEU71_13670 [Actinobacteria bacterium]|nr:hypothetical protein [Actinomycetota bacterium]